MQASLQPNLTARTQYEVPLDRTVPHLLPEAPHFAQMPQVLATGYLVGLVEWACMQSLDGHLDEGERTLGVHVDLSHEAPTPPGQSLIIDVELTKVEGRILTFGITARDEAAVVCRGTHQRAVISLEKFDAVLWGNAAAFYQLPNGLGKPSAMPDS
ncbi:thioesterase family protein [Streptomyces monashensis]|uniref:thioesterase family protein n=1 Tax=Streptomyces monashensis TaxID=1678012 RepID=UPI0033E03D9E